MTEFTDPRLVAIYESVNAYEPDAQPGFYAGLAAELEARTIVDLGCGTGLITRQLARQGYRVIGVDPSAAMVEHGRHAPDGDRVEWIVGGADEVGTPGADLAIMTGHVAQFFLTDDDWFAALAALHRALRPGGWLAFESRDPDAREWETWAERTGDEVEAPCRLRFRTLEELTDTLTGVGFTVERTDGAWDRRPPSPPATRELVVVSARAGA